MGIVKQRLSGLQTVNHLRLVLAVIAMFGTTANVVRSSRLVVVVGNLTGVIATTYFHISVDAQEGELYNGRCAQT